MKATQGGKGLLRGATAVAVCTLLSQSAFAQSAQFIQNPFAEAKLAEDAMRSHFTKKVTKLGLNSSFAAFAKTDAPEVSTTKFKQFINGVEVHGAVGFVHKTALGSMIRDRYQAIEISTFPRLEAFEAAQIARSAGGDFNLIDAPELKIYPDQRNGLNRLAYFINLEGNSEEAGSRVIVDANTGEIVSQVSHHQESNGLSLKAPKIPNLRGRLKSRGIAISPFQIYQTNASCQLVSSSGAPVWLDHKRCDLVITNNSTQPMASASAKQAAENSRLVLEYYQTAHGRRSFDNKGSTAVSIVNVGKKFANAFWDSQNKIMAYGMGDGIEMGDLTQAVDVAGHEMTHGVTSETAQLEYESESGALNEAFSDYFGVVIANEASWVVGKKIFLDPKSKGLRNLANPTSLSVRYRASNGTVVSKAYPAHYQDRFTTPVGQACGRQNDNCWVHINSLIFGHASYKIFNAIGQAKSDRLMYTVLTQYLNPTSNMAEASQAVKSACAALFNSSTCSAVSTALSEVGL